MASRRLLKKQIEYLSNYVIGYGVIKSKKLTGEKEEKMTALIFEAFDLRDEMIRRISHTEPGSVKPFYRRLKKDVGEGLERIMTNMQELSK